MAKAAMNWPAVARRSGLKLAAGVIFATGALLGTMALPAQAYSPNPSANFTHRDTDTCPCSLSDPFDGTTFAHDAGGNATKIELYSGSSYVAKVEFHPYDEKLWVYDTKNDGDALYTVVSWYDANGYHERGPYTAPGTSNTLDYTVINLDVPEGTTVYLDVYDDAALTDYVAGTYAVA